MVENDVLGDLHRLKLDLYLGGQTDLIPRVQHLEESLFDAIAEEAGTLTSEPMDLEAERIYREAENQLLRRDYRRAEELFNRLAHAEAGTRMASLCWFHLGDIYFDFHGDFAGARRCYRRSLEDGDSSVFPAEMIEHIEHRLALLDDTAASNHEPLHLLRQAEAAPASEALDLYRRLLMEHPGSKAVADGIISLAERSLRDLPGEPNFPHEAIALLREYQDREGAAHTALAQLRLADIVYFRLRDHSQALIEYGEVTVDPDNTELTQMVRQRIAQILDSRVSQRDF
jgi:tetratricopeptide (TPR) repeat protein